uniref:NADH-ubiquinone oxidoreductase chain 2 n=1 Tax=Caliris sp. JZ-2017 TaxID=2073104 RepID=A0A343UMW3_9NEOP|nr:NADH dehydrogenase subunit 2 [Caliris sp. JZ-2017]
MPNNSTKILFLMTLISGVLISLSANSWLGAWMGLEINMLSFIPLLISNKNLLSSEASIKYFLIQVIASSSFLFLILLKTNSIEMFVFMGESNWSNLITIPFLLKIACAPFHWWLPSVMEGISWINCFIILSIQKIAPLMLISYIMINNLFTQFVILSSAIIGAIGGLNSTSLRKIISFSSINHLGWLLSTLILGINLWFLYFMIYSVNIAMIITFLSINFLSYIPQTFNSINTKKIVKFCLFISLMSLGGLPPFLGFFPKWISMQFMINNSMNLLVLMLVISSLLTLFYYLRIMFSTLMISNSELMWMYSSLLKHKYSKTLMLSITFIILGISLNTLMILIY